VGGEDNAFVSRTRSVKKEIWFHIVNAESFHQIGKNCEKRMYYYASKPHKKWMNRLMKIVL
jgi:hypothetical protein